MNDKLLLRQKVNILTPHVEFLQFIHPHFKCVDDMDKFDDIYVDGSRIGDVGNMVIKDRKLMSSNGILVIIANIDLANRKLLAKPMITTRGYILVNENEMLIKQIEKNAGIIIEKKLKS